jgi:hypothetical protein
VSMKLDRKRYQREEYNVNDKGITEKIGKNVVYWTEVGFE